MAEGGVLVQRDLGVQGVDLAFRRQDQGVDLGQVAVTFHVAVVQTHQQSGRLLARFGVEVGPVDPVQRCGLVQAHDGVNVQHGDGVGVGDRHFLNLHAALGRQHAQVHLVGAVEREAGVVLLGDVRGVLDPQPLDHVPLDVEPDDVPGVQAHLVGVGGQLHASGLAPAPHLDLSLHHHGIAGLIRLRHSLIDCVGHATGRSRNAEAGEVLLALVLVEIHCDAFSLYRLKLWVL